MHTMTVKEIQILIMFPTKALYEGISMWIYILYTVVHFCFKLLQHRHIGAPRCSWPRLRGWVILYWPVARGLKLLIVTYPAVYIWTLGLTFIDRHTSQTARCSAVFYTLLMHVFVKRFLCNFIFWGGVDCGMNSA